MDLVSSIVALGHWNWFIAGGLLLALFCVLDFGGNRGLALPQNFA